jgi:hypothetical protein
MTITTVSLHLDDDDPPRVNVFHISSGAVLILHLGDRLAVHVPGVDATAVASARRIAAALTAGADELELQLAATTAAEPGVIA